MYKRFLYNDNCILNTKTNTAVFDFSREWEEYQKWKLENPNDDIQDLNEKNNKLLHNGGIPHIIKDVSIFYNKDGSLQKKRYPLKIDYYSNNKIYKTHPIKNDKIVLEIKYSENGVMYEKKNFILKTHEKFDINSGSIVYYKKTKGDLKYEVWYHNKIKIKSSLKKLDKLLKYIEYFNGKHSISKKLHYLNNNMYKCTTYFITGQVRGCGLLSSDNKMHGEWTFYHHNNKVESNHYFSDGKLISKSYLFYENGKLYKEINHD